MCANVNPFTPVSTPPTSSDPDDDFTKEGNYFVHSGYTRHLFKDLLPPERPPTSLNTLLHCRFYVCLASHPRQAPVSESYGFLQSFEGTFQTELEANFFDIAQIVHISEHVPRGMLL